MATVRKTMDGIVHKPAIRRSLGVSLIGRKKGRTRQNGDADATKRSK